MLMSTVNPDSGAKMANLPQLQAWLTANETRSRSNDPTSTLLPPHCHTLTAARRPRRGGHRAATRECEVLTARRGLRGLPRARARHFCCCCVGLRVTF